MLRSALGKVAWVGRTASMVFGLALVLALVVGVSSAALAGNLDPLKIGSLKNAATKTTQLVGRVASGSAFVVKNPSGGTALGLQVNRGQAPLTVNAEAGTATNLDADELDGKNFTEFAPQQVEAWRNVGTRDEPAFTNGWRNSTAPARPVAFYKDPWGVVHLKGMAEGSQGGGTSGGLGIFDLPCGYGPSHDTFYQVYEYSDTTPLRIYPMDPCGNGQYTARVFFSGGREGTWVWLDGITFRAAGS